MSRIILISMVLFMIINTSYSQNNYKLNDDNPKVDIKVNKQYDEQGNLIGYDSTYTYSYSTSDGDFVVGDSVFDQFKSFFNHNQIFSNDPFFSNFFFEDSLSNDFFFNDDFFFDRFQKNMQEMDKFFGEMDSIKNSYLKSQLQSEEDLKTFDF